MNRIIKWWKNLTHFHTWSYLSYFHRKCNYCGIKQKKLSPWLFKGISSAKFDSTWHKFKGSEKEFLAESEIFKKTIHDKNIFGIWAIYNECMIRQNRAFPHYGVCLVMNLKGDVY